MTSTQHTHNTLMIGAQILHLVFRELKRKTPASDVGAALSVAAAHAPPDVRDSFEQHYAQDRLTVGDENR